MTERTERNEAYLQQLTSLPTAAACEQHVIAWLEDRIAQWPDVELQRDAHGNLYVRRTTIATSASPIIIQAHLDHPAFVVDRVMDDRNIAAQFRGGVDRAYLTTAAVRIVRQIGGEPVTARVQSVNEKTQQPWAKFEVVLKLDESAQDIRPGDIGVWDLPAAEIHEGLLHAPVCDDLAAVAAAVSAYETWLEQCDNNTAADAVLPDVRLLFTRAEEVGFVGTLAVAMGDELAKNSRIVALENSKSFAESPIGGGPIIRVGDRTSIFNSDLTYRINHLAQQLADRRQQADEPFAFQRKLMPGGTCEATVYTAMGFTATCLCLPLGNYHNMNESTVRIDREIISIDDFHGLTQLLVEIMHRLDVPDEQADIVSKMKKIWADRRALLEG